MNQLNFQRTLVESCKAGDRDAQYRLYRTYSKAMYNICCRMLNNNMDAEDVLQNSFIDVFKNLHSFNYQSTPGAWIKRIVINNCINFIRKKKIYFEEINDDVDTIQEEGEGVVPLLSVTAVQEAMQELPDGYRMVCSLYMMEGYDHQEIAEIMDISTSTSKSQYHRAKNKLKEILKTKINQNE